MLLRWKFRPKIWRWHDLTGILLMCFKSVHFERITRWWFQKSVIFTPTWGNDPNWLIFFKGVETTNKNKFPDVSVFSRWMFFLHFCSMFLQVQKRSHGERNSHVKNDDGPFCRTVKVGSPTHPGSTCVRRNGWAGHRWWDKKRRPSWVREETKSWEPKGTPNPPKCHRFPPPRNFKCRP